MDSGFFREWHFTVGICARLCIYTFGIIQIVVYDVGGCHMSVVLDRLYNVVGYWKWM